MPAPESLFILRSGYLPLLLRRPVNERFVRALVSSSSLTVVRFWSNDAFVGRLPVEKVACMFSCGVFREVEAFADLPPPVLASGKGVFFRFAFAGF